MVPRIPPPMYILNFQFENELFSSVILLRVMVVSDVRNSAISSTSNWLLNQQLACRINVMQWFRLSPLSLRAFLCGRAWWTRYLHWKLFAPKMRLIALVPKSLASDQCSD
ncbi:hypothetical protein Pla52n_19390 [Stieleria varia]|uniref:Uncharacterized protein n=1 Tax=Stieleria varia TaxID=2528005 RepID=A0A5C6B4I5_9BACT|nr:hypothetical protein Pla52n_19390 [Stieleria varia]